MYLALLKTFEKFTIENITKERRIILRPLVVYIQEKVNRKQAININFICTHNSRRSHLAQVWALFASLYYKVPNVNCYSGGTEETALFPKVAETLIHQGFKIIKISQDSNPIYAIKCSDNVLPLIGFSKKFDHPFNPKTEFAAIMTCSQADEVCPFIPSAEKRIPITFEDPKISDGTIQQNEVYKQRSIEIATEMMYIFSQIQINSCNPN